MTTTRKPAPGVPTVHAYSHRSSRVTVKHVTPQPRQPLTGSHRSQVLYAGESM